MKCRAISIATLFLFSALQGCAPTLSTPPISGDVFYCYVSNTATPEVTLVGAMIYDHDGAIWTGSATQSLVQACPRLGQYGDQAITLFSHDTCALVGAKIQSGSTVVKRTVAHCRIVYYGPGENAVRASIEARDEPATAIQRNAMPAFPD